MISAIDAEEFYDYALAHSTEFVAGLRRLAEDAPTLDITAIAGAAPGWCRLRIGEYRICYYRAHHEGPDGPVTIYAVERIVPCGAFDAAAVSLPEQR